jgi:hypothetical protein
MNLIRAIKIKKLFDLLRYVSYVRGELSLLLYKSPCSLSFNMDHNTGAESTHPHTPTPPTHSVKIPVRVTKNDVSVDSVVVVVVVVVMSIFITITTVS